MDPARFWYAAQVLAAQAAARAYDVTTDAGTGPPVSVAAADVVPEATLADAVPGEPLRAGQPVVARWPPPLPVHVAAAEDDAAEDVGWPRAGTGTAADAHARWYRAWVVGHVGGVVRRYVVAFDGGGVRLLRPADVALAIAPRPPAT
jgi:hypothetical protein